MPPRVYTIKEMNIISQIYNVALTTALPIVLTILQNLYSKTAGETEKELVKAVKNDKHLEEHHYIPSDQVVQQSINNLKETGFLAVDDDRVCITEEGKHAAKLMLVDTQV